jgi:hypothetical protein
VIPCERAIVVPRRDITNTNKNGDRDISDFTAPSQISWQLTTSGNIPDMSIPFSRIYHIKESPPPPSSSSSSSSSDSNSSNNNNNESDNFNLIPSLRLEETTFNVQNYQVWSKNSVVPRLPKSINVNTRISLNLNTVLLCAPEYILRVYGASVLLELLDHFLLYWKQIWRDFRSDVLAHNRAQGRVSVQLRFLQDIFPPSSTGMGETMPNNVALLWVNLLESLNRFNNVIVLNESTLEALNTIFEWAITHFQNQYRSLVFDTIYKGGEGVDNSPDENDTMIGNVSRKLEAIWVLFLTRYQIVPLNLTNYFAISSSPFALAKSSSLTTEGILNIDGIIEIPMLTFSQWSSAYYNSESSPFDVVPPVNIYTNHNVNFDDNYYNNIITSPDQSWNDKVITRFCEHSLSNHWFSTHISPGIITQVGSIAHIDPALLDSTVWPTIDTTILPSLAKSLDLSQLSRVALAMVNVYDLE